jgi:molybdopterin synthase sulfur carrier subunit
MTRILVRYWAAAREAASTSEEAVIAETLAGALAVISEKRRGDHRFAAVLARSSFLVDGNPVGKRAAETVALHEGAVIEVLPAFAGG